MEDYLSKADILMEALPYIQRLANKTVVVKYGGNAMNDERVTDTILQDITLLKYVGVNPVVVHGGGPEINKTLAKLEIPSRFHNGLRITDSATMDVVQMVLTGKINKDITSRINSFGGKAIGLCGKDAGLIRAEKMSAGDDGVDLGYVGEVTAINTKLLKTLITDEYIPVISPIGAGENGVSYNINADTVAGEVAAALHAEKLIFLTDIDGIYHDPDDKSTLYSVINIEQINDLISRGIIHGGMIPKVRGCISSILNGVKRTHILNGTMPHPIVLEIFTDRGIGTMVTE